MSNTTTWTPSDEIFERAKQLAISRSNEHWMNWNWNYWLDYSTQTLNPNYSPCWFGRELGGVYNGPPTPHSPDEYEQTQNLFYIYCWLKYKGYTTYTMAGMMACFSHECSASGGTWEARISPYAATFANNIENFSDCNSRRDPSWGNDDVYSWHDASVIFPRHSVSKQAVTPQGTTITITKTANAGTYAAMMQPSDFTFTMSPEGEILSTEWVHSSATMGRHFGGYGMVQWTYWTQLVNHAARVSSSDWLTDPDNQMLPSHSDGSPDGDGQYHWQLNPTLQLMVLEYERMQSMKHASQQSGSGYYGEWIDNRNGSYYLDENGNKINLNFGLSWDDYASGAWLETLENASSFPNDREKREMARLCMALSLFGAKYTHHVYDITPTSGHMAQLQYMLAAIRYWDANGGYNPAWIPRARDVAYCELDKYHLTTEQLFLVLRRRRNNKNVRAILL